MIIIRRTTVVIITKTTTTATTRTAMSTMLQAITPSSLLQVCHSTDLEQIELLFLYLTLLDPGF